MPDRLALLAEPAVRSAVGRELERVIEYHAVLDSTQIRARALADGGARAALVVAEEQTAGRGRRGNAWHAAPGTSLLASWVLRPAPAQPALVTLLAGVAVARALDAAGCPGTCVKWPNDVQLAGRKIAGALADVAGEGQAAALLLGIGINIHHRADDLPADLSAIATSCAAAGYDVDRLALLCRLDAELARLETTAGRDAAIGHWRARSSVLGREVEVTGPGEALSRGVAVDLADDGALVVESAAGRERVLAGTLRLVA
ncbi:MAG: biotin--[acetyl-CoA-carboxylase] ligase [Candidatus Limnocylindria bacterium]